MDANLQLSAEEMRLVTDPGWILTKNSIIHKTVEMMARVSEEYVGIWGMVFGDGAAVQNGDAVRDGTAVQNGTAVRDGAAGALRGLETGSPKISRGENYRGLPWVMLDYPRVFGREDVLAIRTMFWWGHGFSVTLHLKGRWMRLCVPVIARRRAELAEAGFHIGINDDEWRLEHGVENYRPLAGDGGEDSDVRAGAAEAAERNAGGAERDASAGAAGRGAHAGAGAEELTGGRAFLKLSAAVGLDRWAKAPTIMRDLFGVLVTIVRDADD